VTMHIGKLVLGCMPAQTGHASHWHMSGDDTSADVAKRQTMQLNT
jgi:hypothetical protein